MVGFDGSEMDDFGDGPSDEDTERVEQVWPEGQKAECTECQQVIYWHEGAWFHLDIQAMHEPEPDLPKMAFPNPMDRPMRELEAIWLVSETRDGKVHHFAFFEKNTAFGLAHAASNEDEKLTAWEGNDQSDDFHWEWSNVDASHVVTVDLVSILPGPQWRT